MEIFGEFDGVKWGDVGIAPYELQVYLAWSAFFITDSF